MLKFLKSEESYIDFYTKKYIFKNHDNKTVSSVYIDRKNKHIICLSTMLGCNVRCTFCKSGETFFGNLDFEEIKYMYEYIINDKIFDDRRIVFSYMGSGEPLLNYINVSKSINDIVSSYKNFSISLSFSGAGIKHFDKFVSNLNYYPQIQLSLHSPFNIERKKIIPKSDDLDLILNTLYDYKRWFDKDVELNYILLDGINDNEKHLYELVKILNEYPLFKLKINEYHRINNEIEESKNKEVFIKMLNSNNIFPEVYATDGVNINAACGQLISENERL